MQKKRKKGAKALKNNAKIEDFKENLGAEEDEGVFKAVDKTNSQLEYARE